MLSCSTSQSSSSTNSTTDENSPQYWDITLRKLPVLDGMAIELKKHLGPSDFFADTALISVQHTLPTTFRLFQKLIELGMSQTNIFTLGKIYSESPEGVKSIRALLINHFQQHSHDQKRLTGGKFSEIFSEAVEDLTVAFAKHIHDKNIGNIIILDDGGVLIKSIITNISSFVDKRIAAVEQTTAGIRDIIQEFVEPSVGNISSRLHFPVVMVAPSAAKKTFEPEFIGEAALKSIRRVFPELADPSHPAISIGIVGLGSIGMSIVHEVKRLNATRPNKHKLFGYDKSDLRLANLSPDLEITICENFNNLIKDTDVVFGASGNDVTASELTKIIATLRSKEKPTKLVSCSSENKEFYSLIYECFTLARYTPPWQNDTLPNLAFKIGTHEVTVFRSGYPINFLPPHYSVEEEAEKIQSVLGCLFGALIQARLLATPPNSGGQNDVHRLWPIFQQLAITLWFKPQQDVKNDPIDLSTHYPLEVIRIFTDLAMIERMSGYVYQRGENIDVLYGRKALEETKKVTTSNLVSNTATSTAPPTLGQQSMGYCPNFLLNIKPEPMPIWLYSKNRFQLLRGLRNHATVKREIPRIFSDLTNRTEIKDLDAFTFNLYSHNLHSDVTLVGLFNLEGSLSSRFVLLDGNPGVGKTRFCEYLYLNWAKEKTILSPTFTFAFHIELRKLRSGITSQTNLLNIIYNYYIDLKDPSVDFSASCGGYENFRDFVSYGHQNILLILDGCDEVDLSHLPAFTEELLRNERYYVVFTARPNKFPKYYLGLPNVHIITNIGFNEKDIEPNIAKFFDNKSTRERNEITSILRQNSQLTALAKIPLNLELLCLVWVNTRCFSSFAGSKPITLWKLYRKIFKSIWNRYQSSPIVLESLVSKYHDLIKRVAIENLANSAAFDLPGCNAKEIETIPSIGFLVCDDVSRTRFKFIHETFKYYFVADFLISELTWVSLPAITHCFNRVLLRNYPMIIQFFAEYISDNHDKKKYLFKVVLASRKNPDLSVAASNAISILAAAKFSFSNKDLSNIHVPNADLTGAVFFRTNLKGANLLGCILTNACFAEAMLENAVLEKIIDDFPHPCYNYSLIAYVPRNHSHSTLLVTATKEVSVLDTNTWKETIPYQPIPAQFESKKPTISAIAISHNGNFICIGYENGEVAIRLVKAPYEKAIVSKDPIHASKIQNVMFNNDDVHIVLCNQNLVAVLELYTLNTLRVIKTHHSREAITALVSDPNSPRLAICYDDRTISIFSENLEEIERKTILVKNLVNSICFSKTGRELLVNTTDGKIYFYDLLSKKELKALDYSDTISAHHEAVFSPSIRFLAVSDLSTNAIALISINDGKVLNVFHRGSGFEFTAFGHSIAFSPDERYLSAVFGQRFIKSWQLYEQYSCDVVRSISQVFLDSNTLNLHMLDIHSHTLIIFNVKTHQIVKSSYLPTKMRCSTFDFRDNSLWFLAENGIPHKTTLLQEHCEGVPINVGQANSLKYKFDPTYHFLVTIDQNVVRVFNISTGEQTGSLVPFNKNILFNCVEFIPNTLHVCIACEHEIFFVELSSSKLIHSIDTIYEQYDHVALSCIKFSNSGKYLAAAKSNGAIMLFHGMTSNPMPTQIKGFVQETCLAYYRNIFALEFNNQETLLVSLGDSFKSPLVVWNVQQCVPIYALSSNIGANYFVESKYTSLQFSADDRRLIVACSNSPVEVWKFPSTTHLSAPFLKTVIFGDSSIPSSTQTRSHLDLQQALKTMFMGIGASSMLSALHTSQTTQYNLDIIAKLFGYSPGNSPFIYYVFGKNPSYSFSEEFKLLKTIAENAKLPAFFISNTITEKPDHFITGYFFGSGLIIIDPYGTPVSKPFYDKISGLQQTCGPLSIYISNTKVLSSSMALHASCVMCVEILHKLNMQENALSFPFNSNCIETQYGLSYISFDITKTPLLEMTVPMDTQVERLKREQLGSMERSTIIKNGVSFASNARHEEFSVGFDTDEHLLVKDMFQHKHLYNQELQNWELKNRPEFIRIKNRAVRYQKIPVPFTIGLLYRSSGFFSSSHPIASSSSTATNIQSMSAPSSSNSSSSPPHSEEDVELQLALQLSLLEK